MKDYQTNPQQPLRVVTVGVGAVGGFYAAQLHRAGADVALMCRSDLAVVRQRGLLIHQASGTFHFKPRQVIGQAHEYQGEADVVFIALKALPEIHLQTLIAPLLSPHTVLFLLQNGIDVEKPLQAAFPHHELISGLAFTCLNRTAPGEITHLDYGRLVIGPYPAGESEMADRLAVLFEKAGIPCRVSQQVAGERWRKLVWNAPYNPISVLAQATTRQIMEEPAAALLARQVMEEVLQIAAAEGYPLSEEVVERNLTDTLKMTPYRTSMLLDYEEGRALEVEAILGTPLALARKHQLATPHMATLYALLKIIDRKRNPEQTP
ncbi:MAG: 2-dehydropantoate 2-reductase [Magnetococcales bacterium]|nr:2-dehydropantoate 2-reductase [Magnetococcales bacterium]NGZ26332.1 2-dehydropantoate 2-reductase [Magnetococcales bacterium]